MTVSNTEVAQFPGSAAVDGNPTTRWSSGYSDPQWISIDLGSSQSISRLVLKWETAYAKSYQVQMSDDGAKVARHLPHHHRKRWYQYAVRRWDRTLLAGVHH